MNVRCVIIPTVRTFPRFAPAVGCSDKTFRSAVFTDHTLTATLVRGLQVAHRVGADGRPFDFEEFLKTPDGFKFFRAHVQKVRF